MHLFHSRTVRSRSASGRAIRSRPPQTAVPQRLRGNASHAQPVLCPSRSRRRSRQECACLSAVPPCATLLECASTNQQFHALQFQNQSADEGIHSPPPVGLSPPFAAGRV